MSDYRGDVSEHEGARGQLSGSHTGSGVEAVVGDNVLPLGRRGYQPSLQHGGGRKCDLREKEMRGGEGGGGDGGERDEGGEGREGREGRGGEERREGGGRGRMEVRGKRRRERLERR